MTAHRVTREAPHHLGEGNHGSPARERSWAACGLSEGLEAGGELLIAKGSLKAVRDAVFEALDDAYGDKGDGPMSKEFSSAIGDVDTVATMGSIYGFIMYYVLHDYHLHMMFDFTDPMHPVVKSSIEFSSDETELYAPRRRPTRDEQASIKRIASTVEEVVLKYAQPETSDDGLWWADENFYPIRPMFVGEEPDVKPLEWVTVVDPNGEVIKEAKRHEKNVELPINDKNAETLIQKCKGRLQLANKQPVLSFHVYVHPLDASLNGRKLYRYGDSSPSRSRPRKRV